MKTAAILLVMMVAVSATTGRMLLDDEQTNAPLTTQPQADLPGTVYPCPTDVSCSEPTDKCCNYDLYYQCIPWNQNC